MSSWGCPYDLDGKCQRVPGRDCAMGMKGCILAGRFVFADDSKNITRGQKERRDEFDAKAPPSRPESGET